MLRSPAKETSTSKSNTSPSRSDSDIPKLCKQSQPLHNITDNSTKGRNAKRRRASGESSADSNNLSDFKNEIKDMIKEMMCDQNSRLDTFERYIKEIKCHYTKIQDTNNTIEKSMNYMSDQLTSLEANIASLDKERKTMLLQLSSLQDKIYSLERDAIKTSIEIRNVPKQPHETKDQLFLLVQKVTKALSVDLQSTEIRDVQRHPSKKEQKTSTVTIEFCNTLTKHRLLDSVKDFNRQNSTEKLSSSTIGIDNQKTPIYIAEKLTPHEKQLFFVARKFAKANQYAYCWTSNGRVLIRKDSTSPYVVVKNESQLENMSNANSNSSK